MERKVISLNLAIIVILSALYLYEANLPPIKIHIEDLSEHVGQYVEVRGIILTISDDGSSAKISDKNFHSFATIYSKFKLSLSPGATVVVRGLVEKYRNIYKIVLRDRNDIVVKSDSLPIAMPVLLQNPQHYIGLNVRIYGHVVYWKLIYLNVTDGEDFAHFYVYGHYTGEKKTYFYGTVKNGSLYLETPLNTEEYKEIKMAEIKNLNNIKVRVYGWIVGYYSHLIISYENWSVNVYYYGSKIPQGNLEVKGEFIYDDSCGEYEILSINEN